MTKRRKHYSGQEKVVMHSGLNSQTGDFEPWFEVAMTSEDLKSKGQRHALRKFYEGIGWSTEEERKFPPPGPVFGFFSMLGNDFFVAETDRINEAPPW